MILRCVTIARPWLYVDLMFVFMIPKKISTMYHNHTKVVRLNRLLPEGHRRRGDVGLNNI